MLTLLVVGYVVVQHPPIWVSGFLGVGPAQVIQPEQMQKGYFSVVSAVDDLQIDVPEAPDLVASFVARAVVDDILPPAFVDRLPSGPAFALTPT